MTRQPSAWEMVTGSPLMSFAYYVPQGHAQYCNTSDVLCRYMTTFLCNVTEATCYGDRTTDELFSTVCLTPCQTHHINLTDSSPPRGFSRLCKRLEPANLTEMCFPAEMVNMLPHSDTLLVSDVGRKVWPMKPVFDVDTGGYTVGEEWASFVRAKSLRAGDTVVFFRVLGSALTLFATSRAHSQSVERHNINSDAVSKVIGSLVQSKSVVLTYSPLDPDSDFLVPPRAFRNSVAVNWMCGMRVKKVREYDGENHVGTITSTTFGNSDVPGVMRSLWRCHTVVWDEPNGFDRINFSPWELTPYQEQPQRQPQPPHTLQLFP